MAKGSPQKRPPLRGRRQLSLSMYHSHQNSVSEKVVAGKGVAANLRSRNVRKPTVQSTPRRSTRTRGNSNSSSQCSGKSTIAAPGSPSETNDGEVCPPLIHNSKVRSPSNGPCQVVGNARRKTKSPKNARLKDVSPKCFSSSADADGQVANADVAPASRKASPGHNKGQNEGYEMMDIEDKSRSNDDEMMTTDRMDGNQVWQPKSNDSSTSCPAKKTHAKEKKGRTTKPKKRGGATKSPVRRKRNNSQQHKDADLSHAQGEDQGSEKDINDVDMPLLQMTASLRTLVLSQSNKSPLSDSCMSSLELPNRYSMTARAAQRSLGTANLRDAIKLPIGVDLQEWLAVQVFDIVNEVQLLWSLVSDVCKCEKMTAGDTQYLWKPCHSAEVVSLPAEAYVRNILLYCVSKLHDSEIFPVESDKPFPVQFLGHVKAIMRRIFRVYAHTYRHHFDQLEESDAVPHMNCCFKHYLFAVQEFQLVDNSTLQPLEQLISIFSNARVPPSLQSDDAGNSTCEVDTFPHVEGELNGVKPAAMGVVGHVHISARLKNESTQPLSRTCAELLANLR